MSTRNCSFGSGEARAVDVGALGAAMSGMRRGFAAAEPAPAAPAPKHFRPANPGVNPTAGWDPFDPIGEQAQGPDAALDVIDAARAEGFAAGMAEAERQAAERGEADARALTELAGLLEMMSAFDRDMLAARLRDTVLHLVTRVVGEVEVPAVRLNARIAAAVELLADHSECAQLRLNPADLALVDGHQPSRLTLAADDQIGRGGFRIETRATAVEDGPDAWLAQLAAALDRAPISEI